MNQQHVKIASFGLGSLLLFLSSSSAEPNRKCVKYVYEEVTHCKQIWFNGQYFYICEMNTWLDENYNPAYIHTCANADPQSNCSSADSVPGYEVKWEANCGYSHSNNHGWNYSNTVETPLPRRIGNICS
jgi:hypothetical protein